MDKMENSVQDSVQDTPNDHLNSDSSKDNFKEQFSKESVSVNQPNLDDHKIQLKEIQSNEMKIKKDFQIHYSDTHLQNEKKKSSKSTNQLDLNQKLNLDQNEFKKSIDSENKSTNLKNLSDCKLIGKISHKSSQKSLHKSLHKSSHKLLHKSSHKLLAKSNSKHHKSTNLDKSLHKSKNKSSDHKIEVKLTPSKSDITLDNRPEIKSDAKTNDLTDKKIDVKLETKLETKSDKKIVSDSVCLKNDSEANLINDTSKFNDISKIKNKSTSTDKLSKSKDEKINKSSSKLCTSNGSSTVKLSSSKCSKCKKKQTSNVRIQCKMDQYLSSKLSSMRKELSLSFKIPRVPLPSNDLSHLKYAKFYRTEEHPNGGGRILRLYWDEISNLTEQDRNELAIEFLKESFREEPIGIAKYVISIVHNAAYHMPDFLEYMADTQPNLVVKSGIIGHSGSDIETTTMSSYRDSVEKNYCQGTYRTGPLNQISVVGTAHEEVGGYFPDFIEILEKCPFLKPVMPWGSLSNLKMESPQESNVSIFS